MNTDKISHQYGSPSSDTVTLLTVTLLLIYAGATLTLVRFPIIVWRIISTFVPFLSHPGITRPPDCMSITHVNAALSPWHTVVFTGCCTTTQYNHDNMKL